MALLRCATGIEVGKLIYASVFTLARSMGLEPVGRAIGNIKQDALLPAIALILLVLVIPRRPPAVPPCAASNHAGGAHWGHMRLHRKSLTDEIGQSSSVS